MLGYIAAIARLLAPVESEELARLRLLGPNSSIPTPAEQADFSSCFEPQKWDAELSGLLATLFKWFVLLSV